MLSTIAFPDSLPVHRSDAIADTFNAQIAQRLQAQEGIAVDLVDLADVAVAAALVRTAAVVSGCAPRVAAETATAAAELASNAVRHAGGGVVTISRADDVIVVTVVDRGAATAAALRALLQAPPVSKNDATRGGLGHGVMAVARLMSGLEFDDRVGGGVVARAWRVVS